MKTKKVKFEIDLAKMKDSLEEMGMDHKKAYDYAIKYNQKNAKKRYQKLYYDAEQFALRLAPFIGQKVEVEIEAEIGYEDQGIGGYEFWGSKGIDTQIVPIVDGYKIVSIEGLKEMTEEDAEAAIKMFLDWDWDFLENKILGE